MNRELPHAIEAEQSLLGAMLIYPSVVRLVQDQGLMKEDFFLEMNQRIYDAMLDIALAGKPVDVTTVITRLNDLQVLKLAGDADYIIHLSDTAISPANCESYIQVIKERSQMRQLIEMSQKITELGFESEYDIDDLLDQAEKDILTVTRKRNASDFQSSRMVVSKVIEEINHLRSTSDRVTGIKTGYTDLDHMTNGFQRQDLIILAARPAMGKTAFALNLALNASYYNEGAIAIFSLEMPAESLMKRILSAKSTVESSKLRSGMINDEEYNKLCEAANELMASKIFIDDSSNVKISEVFSKCRKLHSEHGLDLILIDYLQLLSGSGKSSRESRQQEVSEISRSLKVLAREMNCPVIALSQLSRSVESRPDKHPMLSDLRESGSIEQDADIVMFLYRDEYYNKDNDENGSENLDDKTDVDIAKHRNGATGRVELAFRKSISAFFNYTSEY